MIPDGVYFDPVALALYGLGFVDYDDEITPNGMGLVTMGFLVDSGGIWTSCSDEITTTWVECY